MYPSVDSKTAFCVVFYFSEAFTLGIYCILLSFLSFLYRPGQRTVDDLEIIYEELLHIKALSHLSTTVSVFKNTTHHQKGG